MADVDELGSGGRHAHVASSERGQTTCADWLRVPAKGDGVARCVAYETRGYKQAGQMDGRADMQANGPNRASYVLIQVALQPRTATSAVAELVLIKIK